MVRKEAAETAGAKARAARSENASIEETKLRVSIKEKRAAHAAARTSGELELLDAIKLARQARKQRKFEQTWDMMINLRGIDLKKPENRFSTELLLPKGRGKQTKVAIFADLLAADAGKFADLVIPKAEIDILAKDKKRLKRMADEYDFFLGEVALMPLIGKSLGVVLGPRGKVPKPIPPKANLEPLIASSRRTVRLMLKDTPVVYAVIGAEKMSDEDVAENAKAVYSLVVEKLPKGRSSVKSVMVKLTMGRPVKILMR